MNKSLESPSSQASLVMLVWSLLRISPTHFNLHSLMVLLIPCFLGLNYSLQLDILCGHLLSIIWRQQLMLTCVFWLSDVVRFQVLYSWSNTGCIFEWKIVSLLLSLIHWFFQMVLSGLKAFWPLILQTFHSWLQPILVTMRYEILLWTCASFQ